MSNYEESKSQGYVNSALPAATTTTAYGAEGAVIQGPYTGSVQQGAYGGGYTSSSLPSVAGQQYGGQQSQGLTGLSGIESHSSHQHEAQSSEYRQESSQRHGSGDSSQEYGTGSSSNYNASVPSGPHHKSSTADGSSVARGGSSGFGGDDAKDYKSAQLQKDYDETSGGSRLGESAKSQYSAQGQGYNEHDTRRPSAAEHPYAEAKLTGEEPGYKMVEPHAAGKLHEQSAAEGHGSYGDVRNEDTPDNYGDSKYVNSSAGKGGHHSGLMDKVTNLFHKK